MERREKKRYETPDLTVWGSLRDLTQSYFGNVDYMQGTGPGDTGGQTGRVRASWDAGRTPVWGGWNRP